VGHRGQERAAQLLGLCAQVEHARLFGKARPLERERSLSAERLEKRALLSSHRTPVTGHHAEHPELARPHAQLCADHARAGQCVGADARRPPVREDPLGHAEVVPRKHHLRARTGDALQLSRSVWRKHGRVGREALAGEPRHDLGSAGGVEQRPQFATESV
jgi:hypothetical protein